MTAVLILKLKFEYEMNSTPYDIIQMVDAATGDLISAIITALINAISVIVMSRKSESRLIWKYNPGNHCQSQ